MHTLDSIISYYDSDCDKFSWSLTNSNVSSHKKDHLYFILLLYENTICLFVICAKKTICVLYILIALAQF